MFFLINKPKGLTSHDVVNRMRQITAERRVGHGGTLDPNATGLLVIAVGRASTKKLDLFTKGLDKAYEAEIILGEERATDDEEGEVIATSTAKPTKNELFKIFKLFQGELMQMPPQYSAIKMCGQKAYALARKGKEAPLKPRKIVVKKAVILGYNYPRVWAVFEVSSGTYIRALARDIGRKLGTYAYLNNLKRTHVGKFSLGRAVDLNDLTPDNWRSLGCKL